MDHDQNPQERPRELVRLLVPNWQPTPQQVLWAIRITIVLGVLIAIGYPYGITLWDWAKLLIVPAVIAAGGLWFNRQQKARDRKIAERRAQDEALQAYLDKMTELLVVKKLRTAQAEDDVSIAAWARTKTVLRRLNGNRKGAVLRFLNEAGLIRKGSPVIRKLSGADLQRANLAGSYLKDVALKGVVLRKAVLRGANLRNADLGRSEDPQRATDLTDADLSGADLSGADLSGAIVTNEQLEQAASLQGATMPDGTSHP